MSTGKFYVVWKGHKPGIYPSWSECQNQIKGYPGALYKSFKTQKQAIDAYNKSPYEFFKTKKLEKNNNQQETGPHTIIENSLAVDAACSGNPGIMEYRGVHIKNGKEWFLMKFNLGTNNIGEFLAIVHGLAEIKRRGLEIPVYSDSSIAIGWVKNKKCKTKLREDEKTKKLFDLIRRAEKWLNENSYNSPVIKWETEKWGEIPADFGRK